MICLRILRRTASVETGPRTNKLWVGHTDAIPRPDDFISINADDASLIVERVEFDYTTKPTTVNVYVR